MKRVLYITNIEVPYRVRFFNELAKYCDLTVLYERETSKNRNDTWAKSEQQYFKSKYLNGVKVGNESTFSFKILKEVLSPYDCIIVGCYNSPVQMFAILFMRLLHIPYFLNLDGEPFLSSDGLKAKLKRFFLTGADKYLVAGEKSGESLKSFISSEKIIPYYFSSLSKQEIDAHCSTGIQHCRNDVILVIGQYYDYKGMDVALEAARMDSSLRYKFIGMGIRMEQFLKDFREKIPENIEMIPFLPKEALQEEYRNCAMLVLPSRQECWGLVVNEAASYGMPIVSTWGSGCAVEFIAQEYPQYLAKPGNAEDLYKRIRVLKNMWDHSEYSRFLQAKSRNYSIERSAEIHLQQIEGSFPKKQM